MKTRLVASITLLATTVVGNLHEARAATPADKVKASIQNYVKAWNESDTKKRKALLEPAWTEEATYTDPSAHVEGRDALVAHIEGFMSNPQFKGFSLAQASDIDVHHNVFRFEWSLNDPSGNTAVAGIDYGEFNDEGVITKIVGFFGPFPELE